MAQRSHAFSNLPASIDVQAIIERVKGVITFQRVTVDGIAADHRATVEAGLVVAIVGLASAIGLREDVFPLIAGTLLGWVGLSALIWFFADHFLGMPTSRQSFQPLLRTIGYAQVPAALTVIHFIWGLGPLIAFVGFVWSFAATIYAVQRTTRFGLPRAIALTIAGGIIVSIAGIVVSIITGIDPQIW